MKNIISKSENYNRILFLSNWINTASISHYLFNQVQQELKNYKIQLSLIEELKEQEISNQVKTQFYELLQQEKS